MVCNNNKKVYSKRHKTQTQTPSFNILFNFADKQKNPAYGRQSISQPIRIVAPIPKNPASKAKFAEKQTLYRAAIVHPL